MNGDTHAVIGMSAVTTLMHIGVIDPDMVMVMVTGVASYLPDVDHNNASVNRALKINKIAYVVLAGVLLYFRRDLYTLFIAALLVAVGVSRHRAFTHSLLAVFAVVAVTYNLNWSIKIGVPLGYGLHLVADFFNVQGIEIFYPDKRNFQAPVTITTGGIAESVLKMVCGGLLVYNMWYLLKYFR